MFSKILVPLDGTSEAITALGPARIVAAATGAAVHLLTVLDDSASEIEHSRASANLEDAASQMRGQGIAVDVSVRRGSPETEILLGAIEADADLIGMATHGRGGLARAFLGSVAQHIVATSSVPVLLVRPGGHTMRKLEVVLVPVDGSLGGAIALASAVPLARAANARVILLDVVVPVVSYMMTGDSMAGYGAMYFDPEWDGEAMESAKQYVEGMAQRLQHAGIQATGKAVTGQIAQPSNSVAQAIMEFADAEDADLIVMSTHALTGPARALLGSVADTIVRHGGRPVLLPKRSGPTDTTEAHLEPPG